MAQLEARGFTFHYGQIYYSNYKEAYELLKKIYIPLWLDLLLNSKES